MKEQLNPAQIRNMMATLKITDKDTIVCNKCNNDYFIPVTKFAKAKIDLLNEAVFMITENIPVVVCSRCFATMPQDIKELKTKGDYKGPTVIIDNTKNIEPEGPKEVA